MANGNQIGLNPEHRAQLPRSGHDLSHKLGFTATVNHLMPVFHDLLNPGETIDVGFDFNLRTMPLQQAAMTQLKVHTEYFFVPMQLLFEPFADVYYGINDKYSSNFVDPKSTSSFPLLDFDDISKACYERRAGVYFDTMDNYGVSVYRLLDLLGYNPLSITNNGADGEGYNPNVFPWPILAYNAIWQYYYRLDERERFDQSTFNWDKFYNTPLVKNTDYSFTNLAIKTRPLADDYFTSAHVSPIVGPRNLRSASGELELESRWLSRSANANGSSILSSGSIGSGNDFSDAPFGSNNREISGSVQTQIGTRPLYWNASSPDVEGYARYDNGLDIGTANIRAMFANEKLWSITGRAKKHYDDQTLAHFGFEVPHDVKHEISAFGHDYSEIKIGEVISTASTDGAPLGEIAGKGYGAQNSGKHKFTAPCHGVVMVLMSIVPERPYFGTYLKVNALTNSNDLYKPEYDHLGQQPIFGYESNVSGNVASDINGWQYRYEQYKRRFDRTTLAFSNNGTLNSWMTAKSPYAVDDQTSVSQDTYSNFVGKVIDINNIMLQAYNNQWSDDFEENPALVYYSDPFVIDSFISCKKVSTMSDYSLPRLDA